MLDALGALAAGKMEVAAGAVGAGVSLADLVVVAVCTRSQGTP